MNAPDRPEPVRWRALWPAAEYFSAFILSELINWLDSFGTTIAFSDSGMIKTESEVRS